jgi:hypothetical protein
MNEREHLQRKDKALWIVKCTVPQATAYRGNTALIRPQFASISIHLLPQIPQQVLPKHIYAEVM